MATFSSKRVGPDFFSVVWTGFLSASVSGLYTINTVSSDQVMLVLDGEVLINCQTTCLDATVSLVAGVMHPIRIEYRSFTGNSSVSLRWGSGSVVPYGVIPSGNLFSRVVAGSLSALTARVYPNVVDNGNTLVWGSGLTVATAGVPASFSVRSFDRYGNAAWNIMNLNALLQPVGAALQRSRYQSQQSALGPNAVSFTGNLPIAATYYQTSGMHATYYNGALRSVATFPTQIAATYYSWTVSVTLPTKGLYEISVVPWSTNAGLYATYYDNSDFSSPVSSFTQSSVDFSTPAVRFAPPTQASRLANYGFGTGVNLTDPRAFSARWRGFVVATASNVLTFSVAIRSSTERAKLWVDGMLLLNFADFPHNTLSAAATVAVLATDNAGLSFSGINSLFEVVIEYQKPASSSAVSGITMTVNTFLTGYHYSEDHAALPNMIIHPSSACGATSSLSGPGLTRATAGAESTFDIQIRDAYSSTTVLPSYSDVESPNSNFVVVRMVPKVCEVTGRCAFIRANVTSVSEVLGQFRASYRPKHKGSYDLIASIAAVGKLLATYYSAASFGGSRSVADKQYKEAAVTVAASASSVRFQGFLKPPQAGMYTVYVTSTNAANVAMRLLDPATNVAVTGTSSGNAAATVSVDVARSLFDISIDFDSAQPATLMWKYGTMAAAAVVPSVNVYSRNDIKNPVVISTPWGSAGAIVFASETCSSLSLVGGTGLSLATAGVEAKFSITAVDSLRNDRAVAEDEWVVRLTSSCCGNFSASVWPDTRALQSAVYTDNTYSARTGPGRYLSLFTPTRSGSYVITVQRLSQPGLHLQVFCSAVAFPRPCQDTLGSLPLLSKDLLETEEAKQAAVTGTGLKAVWRGFLVIKTTEVLTFDAAANGLITVRIDDQVCADAALVDALMLSDESHSAAGSCERSCVIRTSNLQRDDEYRSFVLHGVHIVAIGAVQRQFDHILGLHRCAVTAR